MFIIEGTDICGKTTTARRIVQLAEDDGKIPARYVHMTRPSRAFDFYFHYVDMISMYGVQDRFHLGALAYHPPGTLTVQAYNFVEDLLRQKRSFLVVFYFGCRKAYSHHLKKHWRDGEMFTPDRLLDVNDTFQKMVQGSAESNPWGFDVQMDDAWDVMNGFPPESKILDWHERWKLRLQTPVMGRIPT